MDKELLPERQRINVLRNPGHVLFGRQAQGEPSGAPRAGVLVGIVSTPEPSLLYTLRAANMSTHAGEVAFPGGKMEREDSDIWATALRESNEEIGLDPGKVDRIGQLDPSMSRFGIEVTPCVALLQEEQQWELSRAETADVFTMPIATMLEEPPYSTDIFRQRDTEIRIPRWKSAGGLEIWGLTARITAEFLCYAYGDTRQLCYPHIRSP